MPTFVPYTFVYKQCKWDGHFCQCTINKATLDHYCHYKMRYFQDAPHSIPTYIKLDNSRLCSIRITKWGQILSKFVYKAMNMILSWFDDKSSDSDFDNQWNIGENSNPFHLLTYEVMLTYIFKRYILRNGKAGSCIC